MLSNYSKRHYSTLLILNVFVVQVCSGPRYSSRIVEIQSGAIRGIILELNSQHLEPVEVFRGVPYAAPPVGPLRFRPPQPPLSWPGTRLADTFGSVCPQKYPDIENMTAALQNMPKGRYFYLKKLIPLLTNQSEDCLFLNIHVPGSGNRGTEAPYAVLVFVHGESFEWGAGHPYDGSVLASYGHVIVVTLNFRLGILGFLKTDPTDYNRVKKDEASTDNLGIQDITAALRWIGANIGSFGGDPTRVTLIGHDTGAALVNLIFVSPISKGLFQRVVLLSGTALSPWAIIHDTDSIRESVGIQSGCFSPEKKDESIDLASCLRSRSLKTLMNIKLETVRFMPTIAPSLPVAPNSIDPLFSMEHASDTFITSELMLGTTTTESYADFNANDIQYGFEEEQKNKVLRTYIRNAYVFHLNEIFSAVRNEYTDWDKPIQHPINIRDSTMEALSDGHTVSPLVRVAYLHAKRGAKTYFFHFGYQTKDSEYPQRLGSVRGEDLTYILGLPLVAGVPFFTQNYSRQDISISEAVLNFFTNFAKSGNPNTPSTSNSYTQKEVPDYGTYRERTKYRGLVWDPYEVGTEYYLSLTSKPKMKSRYRGHKMAVWLNLIPQLHQPGDKDVSMRHHHFYEREPHFYAGAVRAESFTKIPHLIHSVSIINSHIGREHSTDCIPNTTTSLEDIESRIITSVFSPESEEVLHRFTTRQYYSYTAALGVTIGVGCLLLFLNVLIFAGIYYQRGKERQRKPPTRDHSSSNSSTDVISYSQQHTTIENSIKDLDICKKEKEKLYQPYATIPNSIEMDCRLNFDKNSLKKDKQAVLLRTANSTFGGSIKKRVQIQEISV